MATQSFYEMMVIDTPEKAENLGLAFEDAEKRGALRFEDRGVFEKIKEGEEHLRNHPL